jgi:hypothetical protein
LIRNNNINPHGAKSWLIRDLRLYLTKVGLNGFAVAAASRLRAKGSIFFSRLGQGVLA